MNLLGGQRKSFGGFLPLRGINQMARSRRAHGVKSSLLCSLEIIQFVDRLLELTYKRDRRQTEQFTTLTRTEKYTGTQLSTHALLSHGVISFYKILCFHPHQANTLSLLGFLYFSPQSRTTGQTTSATVSRGLRSDPGAKRGKENKKFSLRGPLCSMVFSWTQKGAPQKGIPSVFLLSRLIIWEN